MEYLPVTGSHTLAALNIIEGSYVRGLLQHPEAAASAPQEEGDEEQAKGSEGRLNPFARASAESAPADAIPLPSMQ